MTLNAGNEETIAVSFGVLDEVGGSLLGGDSNEGNTLVGGLEPNNLGTLDNFRAILLASVTLALSALSFLLLLGSGRGGTKKTECAGEELTRHAFDNGDDVTGILRLDFVGDPDL